MTAKIENLIFNEFDRLGVSTNQDPYSGLMVELSGVLDSTQATVVKIYDDYESSFYTADTLFLFLVGLTKESLSGDMDIWELIKPYEI
jgi:hypothetical protein